MKPKKTKMNYKDGSIVMTNNLEGIHYNAVKYKLIMDELEA